MKEFAIDDRGTEADLEPPATDAALGPIGPEMLPPWLRPLLLLAALEALALGIFLAASSPRDAPSAASGSVAIDTGPASTFASLPPSSMRPEPAVAAAVAQDEPVRPDGIMRTDGSIRIELHEADPAQALAMLSEATHATVRGREVLAQRPERITRSLVVRSPLEAWQAVFGDVASFAAHCSSNACAVRFVSAGETSTAVDRATVPTAPVAPNVPNVQATDSVPPPTVPAPDPAPSGDAPVL